MFALFQVVMKEFFQLKQDRKMIPVMIVGPLIQLLALGYAANLDVNQIPMLLVDQDRSPASGRLVEQFTGSGYFRLAGQAATTTAIEPWLVDNRAQIALVVRAGYGKAIASGRKPELQLVVDGTDANTAVVGMGYASRLVAEENGALVRAALRREATASGERRPVTTAGGVEILPRVFYNPDLRSRWFYVPAVLAMVLMLITMMLPSMAVVREKEIGTLEQISVTPLRPWQLIAGKLVPFAIIGLFDTVIITGLSLWIFGVPLRGSFALLLFLTAIFLLNMLGLGLLVSTMVRTQQQAMMASAFMVMVPMIYLSGLIFPLENMPEIFQWISTIIPVRYYGNVVRGVFLRGSGLDVLWIDAVAMTIIATIVLTLSSLRFRKSLD